MIPWPTVAKWAWDALQPPDPNSPIEKVTKVVETYEEIGHACELANEVMRLNPLPADEKGE